MSTSPTHLSRRVYSFSFIFLSILIFGDSVSAEDAPPASALWEKGKVLFDNTCSVCHGPDGEGQGDLGFKLTSDRIRFATDEQIEWMIRDGNLTKGMPPFDPKHLEEGKLRDFGSFSEPLDFPALIAYIRHLQGRGGRGGREERTERVVEFMRLMSPDGDAERGKALFVGKARCIECHSIDGGGVRVGPDLAGIASRLTPGYLLQSIFYPSEAIAPGFAAKELTLPRGRKVIGIFRNETSESIEIYDSAGDEWKTHLKEDVLSYRTLRKSLMPEGLLDDFSEQEKHDLLAYLMTLK